MLLPHACPGGCRNGTLPDVLHAECRCYAAVGLTQAALERDPLTALFEQNARFCEQRLVQVLRHPRRGPLRASTVPAPGP